MTMTERSGKPIGIASTIISEDQGLINYRPRMNKMTGSVIATILLNQMMYWAKRQGNGFYKFVSPCSHELYIEGDSWTEELKLTKHEFYGAIKKIGFKRGKSSNEIESEKDAYIIYYTTKDRLTYWIVNWDKIEADLSNLYNRNYLVNPKSGITKVNPKSGITNYISETTSENTVANTMKQNKLELESLTPKKENKYDNFAKKLKACIESVRKVNVTSNINSWATHFRKLHEIDRIELPRIQYVLDEYKQIIGMQYVPVVYSAKAFREKFLRVEDAVKRINNDSSKTKESTISHKTHYKNGIQYVWNDEEVKWMMFNRDCRECDENGIPI